MVVISKVFLEAFCFQAHSSESQQSDPTFRQLRRIEFLRWCANRHAMATMACFLCSTPLPLSLLSRRPLSRSKSTTNVISCAQSSGNFPGCGSEKSIGKLESLFYTDSGIPQEKIERPTGLPKGLRAIGNNPRCPECKAKGVVECATCAGSGLYVDSVLESQGIIVKVRCLGCGGVGNHMCLQCGGRGHV